MKKIITLVVIVVALHEDECTELGSASARGKGANLKNAFPGLLLVNQHDTVYLFEGNDKRALITMDTAWARTNDINTDKIIRLLRKRAYTSFYG